MTHTKFKNMLTKFSMDMLSEQEKDELEDHIISCDECFKKFFVQEKSDRRGRNPSTGEDLMLGARRVVGFKCSGVLVNRINEKADYILRSYYRQ